MITLLSHTRCTTLAATTSTPSLPRPRCPTLVAPLSLPHPRCLTLAALPSLHRLAPTCHLRTHHTVDSDQPPLQVLLCVDEESGENCTLYLCTPSLFFGYQDCQGENGVQFSLWRENPDENPDFWIFLGVQCVRKSGFTDCTPKFSYGVQSVSCLGVQSVIRGYNL